MEWEINDLIKYINYLLDSKTSYYKYHQSLTKEDFQQEVLLKVFKAIEQPILKDGRTNNLIKKIVSDAVYTQYNNKQFVKKTTRNKGKPQPILFTGDFEYTTHEDNKEPIETYNNLIKHLSTDEVEMLNIYEKDKRFNKDKINKLFEKCRKIIKEEEL